MRPLDRVMRTRRALAATIAARAVLVGIGVALLTAALATIVVQRSGGPASTLWIASVVAGVLAAVVLGRSIARLTVERVALWIEEHAPTLQFALVTAVDPMVSAAGDRTLDAHLDRISWADAARRAMAAALRWPTVLAATGVVAFLVAARIPAGTLASTDVAVPSVTTTRGDRPPAPFARLTATVTAPAYAGGRSVRVESPAAVAALVGSSVLLAAPGDGVGITATVGEKALGVDRAGDTWRVSFTIGPEPTLVRLTHPSGERIVAVEPRPDSVPVVRLLLPARDTVMRVARGNLPLSADTHDDIGLASVAFEYIVSSGEGESFQFKSGTLGARALNGARDASVQTVLPLEGLGLEPGDMVHLRAVARDRNAVSGPGIGASETRVLRVARASEYDSIAVEGAPPPEADKSLISQRMLIMMTEALEQRRPKLARETLLSESRTIARDQTRLRRRVGDIIFARLGNNPSGEEGRDPDDAAADSLAPVVELPARDSARRAAARAGRSAREIAAADSADSARAALLRAASAATGRGEEILDFEGDETPVVAINRPLLEAYNAMWEATRELDQGETGKALPPMRRALDAIQRARQAERIYLRGKAPAVVVDLGRVRLTGKDTGNANSRAPRAPADPAAARRAERLASAIALAASSPSAAIDSLVLLRVESLDAAPRLAAALGDALETMRTGRDAATLLARARRIADGSVRGVGELGTWSGVW